MEINPTVSKALKKNQSTQTEEEQNKQALQTEQTPPEVNLRVMPFNHDSLHKFINEKRW